MMTVLVEASAGRTVIDLGRRGENLARQIVFDVRRWSELYGGGTAQLLHKRPGESDFYPCALSRVSGDTVDRVLWKVTSAETEKAGAGQAELRYIVGETLVKSVVFPTAVAESLSGAETSVPSPAQGWADQVLSAASAVAQAVVHAPRVGSYGNWEVWDQSANAYADTGVPAAGEPPAIGSNGNWLILGEDTGFPATGPMGPQGPKGDTGETGPQGPKGDTGDTGPQGPKGDQGDPGQDGTSFTVKGLYGSLSQLRQAHPTGAPGDAYAVGTEDDNTIYVWSEDEDDWVSVGKLQGPQGPKGDTGDTGPQGPAGADGAQGPAGADGEDGGYYQPGVDSAGNLSWTASKSGMPAVAGQNIKGPKGDTGDTGPQGPKGDTGDTGPQGPKGDTGDTGPQGPAGADGEDGKSAYEAATEAGYTGTEAEFNAALQTLEDAPFQTKLNGTPGQVVGFDSDGNATAEDLKSDILRLEKFPFTIPADCSSYSVAFGANRFVVVGGGNSSTAWTSTDGRVWASVSLPFSGDWRSVTYGGGKFVAVASESNKVAYSEDGMTWMWGHLPISALWSSVAYGDGKFVAIAAGSNTAAYSTDCIFWTEAELPETADWISVAYGGGRFVAVTGALSSREAAYSTDGITWTSSTTPPDPLDGNSVAYGNGLFIAVGYPPFSYAYSADGGNWETGSFPDYFNYEDLITITYGNGRFVAIAGAHGGDPEDWTENSTVVYSTDGITWESGVISGNQPEYWCSVAYGNGVFLAVSPGSNVSAYSADGESWVLEREAIVDLSGSEVTNTVANLIVGDIGTLLDSINGEVV